MGNGQSAPGKGDDEYDGPREATQAEVDAAVANLETATDTTDDISIASDAGE